MEATRKAALAKGEKRYFTGVPCKQGHIATRRSKTGECLECRTIAVSVWRKENPEQVKKHNRAQYNVHAEKIKAGAKKYYAKNLDSIKVKSKEYQKQNLSVFAANNAKRDAAKSKRTPAWLTEDDKWLMAQAYELAALRAKMVGGVWHVDHILPLQGKKVSGLHVPINLQVIPAKANRSKSNSYEVL